MKLSLLSTLGAAASALLLLGAPGNAQIQRLDLTKMVEMADDAIVGTIINREVFRVDHPVDGPELYFTTLTIEGESLYSGAQRTAHVTFPGGFIDDNNGVYNSEAPSADDIRLGNEVLAFSAWTDNMGGGVAAHALVASHGGLYTTVATRRGLIIQGRGSGYALAQNEILKTLRTRVRAIRQAQGK